MGLLLVLCALCVWQGGCNLIAGPASVLARPPLVEAKYDLPDKKTLVVVEDAVRPVVNNPQVLRRVAGAVSTVLEAEQAVTVGLVGQDELDALRAELGTQFARTSIAGLGIRLKARQVIHVRVISYQIDVGGNVVRPNLVAEVKVVDLDKPGRVFPAEFAAGEPGSGAEAYVLESSLPARDLSGQSAARTIVERELADQAGRDIARLFFDWRMPERGSELGN